MATATVDRLNLEGEHLHRSPAGDVRGPMYWKVRVRPWDGVVERSVWRGSRVGALDEWRGDQEAWEPEEVIWPAWSPSLDPAAGRHTTPLREAREHWGRLGERLRETAKWMSTVLGAALALLLGTSPLGKLSEASLTGTAVLWGVIGLGCLFATLWLLLTVLQPTAVSFADVQTSDRVGIKDRTDPLVRWKRVVEAQQDLYLPCGINSLEGLRNAVIVEEATLAALAGAIQRAAQVECRFVEYDAEAAAWVADRHRELIRAAEARTARLHDLKDAVGEVAVIGEFYVLKQRSWTACLLGAICTAVGIACVVAALAAAR